MSTKAVMVPQKFERYVNLYWREGGPSLGKNIHESLSAANSLVESDRKERIACLKIIVTTELA